MYFHLKILYYLFNILKTQIFLDDRIKYYLNLLLKLIPIIII
jgi:hypothetical protein